VNIFDGADSALDSVFDDLDIDSSFSAGVHMEVTVGFGALAEEFAPIPNMTKAATAVRLFIRFDDILAKISITTRIAGEMFIAV
jgi:hypothetical protein